MAQNLTLSVNLSFGQFAENEFVDPIRGALEVTGFPPERLELELTESMLALEPERASETTRRWPPWAASWRSTISAPAIHRWRSCGASRSTT